ncbi:BNR-4 repeat-containing protein [Porifericola rhodea]|uniref:BNR-4 repeat-containing protein n=1 Tax=Porifericola rhodea TaxID=930972 RepID=UPI0026662172|nr:BNR-4 repeat-containing protein [Porifericola rhodea]WKN30968.1 BNR-4 repeat-containing protein [Porifericola rhodea]
MQHLEFKLNTIRFHVRSLPLILLIIFSFAHLPLLAQQNIGRAEPEPFPTVDGYKGIWFTLNQFYEYGDKYSGGLGTYTAKHNPLAIYAEEVDKTFFVYGGTRAENEKYLLCMIGSYDHKSHTLSKPIIVHDKEGVDDPHDNPSLSIDAQGYLWVFVSGRGKVRPGYKYKSTRPYDASSFERVSTEELTYPQPWYLKEQGFLHLFTKYTGVRELYYESSKNGRDWTQDHKLAGIRADGDDKGGHYQMSKAKGNKVVTFFNWHPNGNVDQRTNLYYLQTTDLGNTWTTAEGEAIELPLTKLDNSARLQNYYTQQKNVYLKDVDFDRNANPIGLYITSRGHEPGPDNGPREWHVIHWNGTEWSDHIVTTSDHNYDMGSLIINDQEWMIVAPTKNKPQQYGGGGEIEIWVSTDEGKSWKKKLQLSQGSDRNHNYVRKVFHGKDPFLYFWADGNPDQFSRSEMYFGDSQGNYWKLPYEMSKSEAEPVPMK